MAKTNTGLVAYAKAKVGCYYWFGTFGQMASRSLYNSKKEQYPKYYTASDFDYQISHPKQVFDCAGLIKAYLWTDSIDDTTPTYNSSQDYGATGFYNQAKKKGSLPNNNMKVGTLVFKGTDSSKSHVGVYVGDNTVVEAKGHAYGVITSTFSSGGWKYWAECHLIDYSSEPSPAPTPSKDQYTVHTNSGDALRLRAEPTTDSAQVGYIDNGQTVTAEKVVEGEWIGDINTWILTTYGGKTGYASGKYLSPTPEIKKGSYSFEVSTVENGTTGADTLLCQKLLLADGFKGKDGKVLELDGECGTNTAYAITAFQKDKGIEADGICGQKTWKALLGV